MSANFSPELEGYSGVQPFRFWCQKVLPLAYDDSLSYYELLCKVVDYLNKTIEDVAATETNVQALKDAYDSLENYVNSYFESLDVQEEINNKLDTMVTDGTLSGMLSDLVGDSIPDLVTNWLNANVTPVGSAVVVDSTLTVSGAAADAKVVGNSLEKKLNADIINLNRFNPETSEVGYVSYSTGELIYNASYRTSDYIEIDDTHNYRLFSNTNQQVAIYDANKGYLSGYVNSNSFNLADNATQIPTGAKYLRFAMSTADLNNARFYEFIEYSYLRYWWPNYGVYEEGCIADRVKGEPIVFSKTVASVLELVDAINNIYLTDGYVYNIYLAEGTYAFTAGIIAQLRNHTEGFDIPDNTNLIGLGSGAIITMDLTGRPAAEQQQYSTISLKKNNTLKNLKVYATNCRYCVHADNSNTVSDVVKNIEDCEFIDLGNSDGNWAYPAAWGAGTGSGEHVTFTRCKFVSPLRAFYVHNNVSFDNPSVHVFNECTFIGKDSYAFMIESLGSGVEDKVVFNGCIFKGLLRGNASSGAPTLTSPDFKVIGTGNSPVCDDGYFGGAFEHISAFSDECYSFVNTSGGSISKNTLMKMVGKDYAPMTSADDYKSFVGVLLFTVNDGEIGYIKHKGCFRVTGALTSSDIGTKVTVENGNLAIASQDSNNYIGRVFLKDSTVNRNYIKIEQ